MTSPHDMASGLAALLAREHGCMADFLEALAAFHRRRAWEDLGHASLFAFLTRELGLSRAAAYSRLVASDLAARFPEVLAASNLAETLPRFFHLSRREAAEVAAARDAPSHSHPGASLDVVLEVGLDLVLERHRKRRGIGAKGRVRGTNGPTESGSRPRTAGSLQSAARLESDARLRSAGKPQPERPRPAAPGRITAEVKRRVWERDGGRCQWPLDGGGTCGSTLRLELDHRMPRGKGGGSGESNLRLLCRIHNPRAARLVHGDAHMDRFARDSPAAREPCAPGPFPLTALRDRGRVRRGESRRGQSLRGDPGRRDPRRGLGLIDSG